MRVCLLSLGVQSSMQGPASIRGTAPFVAALARSRASRVAPARQTASHRTARSCASFSAVREVLARVFAWGLVVVHAGLGAWAVVGLVELAVEDVPWARVSNPLFSPSMLALQWTLIATAATTFIAGYVTRSRHTPVAMLLIYGAMAIVCAYQTFFILTDPARFRAMALEYAEYAVILVFLFASRHMRARFRRAARAPGCHGRPRATRDERKVRF